MKEKEHYIYCIENLTVVSWTFSVFPYIFRKIRSISKAVQMENGKAAFLIYYLKASQWGLRLARLTLSNRNATFKLLDFSLVEIKDENGDLIWWKSLCHDSFAIQRYIKMHPEFQNFINQYGGENRLPQFLMRHIMFSDIMNSKVRTLPELLFLIRVVTSYNVSYVK